MQLVIKDTFLIAYHDDGQNIAGLYPGCEVVSFSGAFTPNKDGLTPDPRTDAEKALAYRDNRRNSYPSLADQLDMLYWDKQNGTSNWQDMVTATKAKYPKA